MNKYRARFLYALGGVCVRCGCDDIRRLEVHDVSGEHRGYGNKQRFRDIREYCLSGRIPRGRFLLCDECHDVEHGSAFTKVKAQIKEELRKLKNNV